MAGQKVSAEPIIEPDLPIIDPHHHLWFLNATGLPAKAQPGNDFHQVLHDNACYLLEDFLADVNTGHNIIGTVFLEVRTMYRQDGPEAMKSLGEIEFITGVAAMAESGTFGPVKVGAGIVGNADLKLGDAVEEVLLAHIKAAGGRYRGVRNHTIHDSDETLLGAGNNNPPHVIADKMFRTGFKYLRKYNLAYDVWLFEPQLPDLIDLARAFPDTQIVLNHVATPLGTASYAGKREALFPKWRDGIRAVAKCENVAVKVGGLGMPLPGFKSFMAAPPATSEQLAAEWKPYIETCIEAFGAQRCMFESNFPVDAGGATYPVLWNAFKRLAAGASRDEKTALFSGTAKRIYRLDL